nr:winged helix-turn-helix domain-containing protein [Methylorubrum zatmanii]
MLFSPRERLPARLNGLVRSPIIDILPQPTSIAKNRATIVIPSLGALDRRDGHLGRQLAQRLRNAVATGQLKPGEPLPSTRTLAASLGVARGLVVEAFDQLRAEG